jgi:hypothetical protein
VSTFVITTIWTRHKLNYFPVFTTSEHTLAASSIAFRQIEHLILDVNVGVSEKSVPYGLNEGFWKNALVRREGFMICNEARRKGGW